MEEKARKRQALLEEEGHFRQELHAKFAREATLERMAQQRRKLAILEHNRQVQAQSPKRRCSLGTHDQNDADLMDFSKAAAAAVITVPCAASSFMFTVGALVRWKQLYKTDAVNWKKNGRGTMKSTARFSHWRQRNKPLFSKKGRDC